jgi:DNA-directed RNA polymerase specialized sigma24 family protein
MTAAQAGTLGAVLYAGVPNVSPEEEWLGLVQSIARGDRLALHELYERMHRVVFTLIWRITGDPQAAEEQVLDVFCDVWRRAAGYRPDDTTVIGWVMNLARSRAIDPRPTKRIDPQRASLRERIALPVKQRWVEPEWLEVAPGISCKLLAADTERHRISMLVRLVPGGEYPPHTHAGLEELHLLDGELWIDERKVYPGDYNRAEPGTGDKRVWSETGCSCVLVTSTQDVLHGPASDADSPAIAQPEDTYRATLATAVELVGGAAQLARRLHVPVADLKQWLAGADRPSMGTFLKVVDLLIEEREKPR